ncbi:unnamed protein product [Camellia sinensis]
MKRKEKKRNETKKTDDTRMLLHVGWFTVTERKGDIQAMAMACSSSSSTCSIFSPDMRILNVPLLSKPTKKFNHIHHHHHHHHHHHDERTVGGVGRPLLLYRRFQKNPSSSSSSPTSLSVKCFSHRQSTQQEEKDEEFQLERLFSDLNQATLKREPGSLSSAILLVSGTTVGAGILAIPAVTQESGFLASAVTCIVCWVFMVVTGLLIAEVNVKTMCELGSGGVSLIGINGHENSWDSRSSNCMNRHNWRMISSMTEYLYIVKGVDWKHYYYRWESETLFSLLFGGICFFGSQRFIGAINGVLVFGIITSFTALVVVASRTAIVLGTAIPLALFVVWNAVILGSITSFEIGSDKIIDPLQQLQSANRVVGPIVDVFSLLAIATSYIGFVLGLADFLAD